MTEPSIKSGNWSPEERVTPSVRSSDRFRDGPKNMTRGSDFEDSGRLSYWRVARLNAEHVGKNLRWMVARIHLVIDARKLTVFID